jgi:hypothetical protein
MMATWTTMEVMCISAIETIQTIQGIIWRVTAKNIEVIGKAMQLRRINQTKSKEKQVKIIRST